MRWCRPSGNIRSICHIGQFHPIEQFGSTCPPQLSSWLFILRISRQFISIKLSLSLSHSTSMLHRLSSIPSPNLHSFLRIKVRNVRQSPHLRTWHSFTPRLATNSKSKMSQNPTSSDAESRRPKKFICTNKVSANPQLLYCAQVTRENYPAGNWGTSVKA